MEAIRNLLAQALQSNQLSLPANATEKLGAYLDLLDTWNHAFNLTAITQPKEMVYLHIVDSLSVAPFVQGKYLLDVGSGAGLPGIPLAITHPEQQWTTLDKNNKKARFLTQVVAELELPNVSVACSRCEDFKPAQRFDSIISRAFGSLKLFVESTAHLLDSNGIFIAMKGKYPEDELSNLPSRFKVVEVKPLSIKGIDVERHVVIIKQQ